MGKWYVFQHQGSRRAWAGTSSQAHYFPGGANNSRHGDSKALCGRWVSLDYQDAQPPRENMPERFYCQRCLALLAKAEAERCGERGCHRPAQDGDIFCAEHRAQEDARTAGWESDRDSQYA